ncbi:hypothetical protein NUM3379_29090 [Kineococcus sp. NUM-3379]
MSILRALWAPLAVVGSSFGRYWLGTDRAGEGAEYDQPRRPGPVAVAWRTVEPVVVLLVLALFAGALAAGTLTA